jgi:hypothetical protein
MMMVRGSDDVRIKKSAKKLIERATAIEISDIYHELPALIDRVRKILAAGTTQTSKRHPSSAGLIKPLTHAG